MSARNAMAAMLDELMGTKRNLDIGTDLTVTYDDPNICKFYIAGFCPHEMFVNTKADLGACPKIHDDKLRIEYPTSSAFEKMGFEQDFLRFLIRLEDDNQRRIKRNKEKLNQTDALTQVCEVCGSMLIRNDAQVRVEEHLMGKMHMGFAKIQVTIKELKEKFRKQEEEKDKEREERKKRREEPGRSDRDRGDRRDRDRDRNDRGKDKDRGRDRRDRDRDTKRRSRSRSRDRHRDSRDNRPRHNDRRRR